MSPEPVATLSEIPVGTSLRVDVGDVPVCLVRTDDGVHAVSDICSHAEISLSEGEVDGATIECWLHGSRFDVLTGRPSGLPATQPIPVYPVTVDGDTILVDVPDDATTEATNLWSTA